VVMLTMVSVGGLSSRGWATGQLVLPGVGAQDVSLNGNAVALPLNPASALFHNPAQLTLLPNSVTAGLLAIHYQPRYTNPSGYDDTTDKVPLAPSLAYVTDRWAPFHVGIGVLGALGLAYDHPADPARGV